jgi:hypothetical protein
VNGLARHAGLFPPPAISSSKIEPAHGAKCVRIGVGLEVRPLSWQAAVMDKKFPIKPRNG